MKELTQAEVGYLAGLLDGEGCISVLRVRSRRERLKGRVVTHYAIQIRIGNTFPRLLDWIAEKVGGRVYAIRWKARGNRKPCWHWYIGGKAAKPFLELVRPYLIVKAKQADVAMRFLALGRDFDPSARADLYEQMRGLNFRGLGEGTADTARASHTEPNYEEPLAPLA